MRSTFLEEMSEMIGEHRRELARLEAGRHDTEMEIVVLERIQHGESIEQIVRTGNPAILQAVRRIAVHA